MSQNPASEVPPQDEPREQTAESPSDNSPRVESPPEPTAEPSLADRLQAQLTSTEEKLRACVTSYRQVVADIERERERGRSERERQLDRDRMGVARGLLDVLENLDRSLIGAPTEGPGATLTAGVRMVRGQFLDVLREFGAERMEVLGRRFDVTLHEATAVISPSETCPDQHVAFEVSAGYLFKGQMLRAARVVVAQVQEES